MTERLSNTHTYCYLECIIETEKSNKDIFADLESELTKQKDKVFQRVDILCE